MDTPATGRDRHEHHPGYDGSPWPVECGGNRRQKAALGRLEAGSGTAAVTTRQDTKWHVMVINKTKAACPTPGAEGDACNRAEGDACNRAEGDANEAHKTKAACPTPGAEGDANEAHKTKAACPTPGAEGDACNRAEGDACNRAEGDAYNWYVGGTMPAFSGPPPFGWVERIDPDTLEPLAVSPELPCGEHVWCGAILAHANGSIMSVNGSFLHRLDPDDLSVVVERELPADRSHNGLLALADGTLITKDLRLEGQGGTTITRLDPDTLELVGAPLVLPEGSMGRIAADRTSDGEFLYVPGTEHLWRLSFDDTAMHIDDWQPKYRDVGGDFGLAWDSCLSAGACWSMDCGDLPSIRMIHTTEPNGRWDTSPGRALSWRQPAPWRGAQRVIRTSLTNPHDVRTIAPFGHPGGGIIAPPVHVPEHNMTIAWDSVNGGLAGVTMTDDGDLDVAWHLEARPSMQPIVYPESAELVINDFTADGSDDLIVVDIASGELIDRVSTGSRVANGMFLSPGPGRSVFYCSTLTLARVSWT